MRWLTFQTIGCSLLALSVNIECNQEPERLPGFSRDQLIAASWPT